MNTNGPIAKPTNSIAATAIKNTAAAIANIATINVLIKVAIANANGNIKATAPYLTNLSSITQYLSLLVFY